MKLENMPHLKFSFYLRHSYNLSLSHIIKPGVFFCKVARTCHFVFVYVYVYVSLVPRPLPVYNVTRNNKSWEWPGEEATCMHVPLSILTATVLSIRPGNTPLADAFITL